MALLQICLPIGTNRLDHNLEEKLQRWNNILEGIVHAFNVVGNYMSWGDR